VVNLRMTDNTVAIRKKSFLDLPLLITSLVSTNFFRLATVLSVILRFTTSTRKKFVDTKVVIRSGKSKNDRQYSGHTKKVCRYQGGN
jgi:hypothetical protein